MMSQIKLTPEELRISAKNIQQDHNQLQMC